MIGDKGRLKPIDKEAKGVMNFRCAQCQCGPKIGVKRPKKCEFWGKSTFCIHLLLFFGFCCVFGPSEPSSILPQFGKLLGGVSQKPLCSGAPWTLQAWGRHHSDEEMAAD